MTRILTRTYDVNAMHALTRSGVPAPIARALAARGVKSVEDLDDEWRGLIPPAKLEGTREAAERLSRARRDGESVCVVGDYDCDGATASTVAVRGLRMLGLDVNFYIPDRVADGYGLTADLVELVKKMYPETSLIITVDNGVNAVKAVARANELGVDVIVTDHHLPGRTLPDAEVIVNPNLPSSTFPSKALAGVGVIFYVLLAFRSLLREEGVYTSETQPNLACLVDLVALGTVADVVRLDHNNRVLVARGLERVRSGRTWPGLAALFAVAGRDITRASVKDFGFSIAPRINAAGRLATMEDGITCLLTDSDDLALTYARNLNDINSERRELQAEMQEAAEEALSRIPESALADKTTFSLYDPSFNEGVVGLVASRLKEKHNRPTIVFAQAESGDLKGSGRSIKGVHLRDILDLVDKKLPGALVRFGGHAMAAGLTLKKDAFHDFSRAFEEAVRETSDPALFEHVVYSDGGLAPDEMTEDLVMKIERHIWGQGFETPVFANEFEVLEQRLLKDAHLKLRLRLGNQVFDGIFFRHAEPLPREVKLAYRLDINEYRGRRSVQLIIEGAGD